MTFDATIIDDDNRDVFCSPLSEETARDCDIFIGLYEQETDTACGVLAAAAVPDGDDERVALSMREYFIADGYDCYEARKTMLRYLQEIAGLYGCTAVFVPEYIEEGDDEHRKELLSDMGFYEEDKVLSLYKIKVSDVKQIYDSGKKACLNLSGLSDKQWEQFVSEALVYSFDIEDRDYYDPETSIFLTDNEGNIEGGILAGIRDGNLYIEGIAPFGGDEETLIKELVASEYDAIKNKWRGKAIYMYMLSNRIYNRILKEVTDGKAERIGSLVNFTYEVPV